MQVIVNTVDDSLTVAYDLLRCNSLFEVVFVNVCLTVNWLFITFDGYIFPTL